MLFYIPLEPYVERYTVQLSRPITGWFERNLIKENVKYQRVEGESLGGAEITNGSVLDATGRCFWALEQCKRLVQMADDGFLDKDSVLYFEDFWHPGIEAMAYIRHQLGIPFKMYALCHAQSIDVFDFTYPMRHWMRHFEKGIGKILEGVFVTSTILKELVIEHGIGTPYLTGLPYCSEEVREHFPKIPWRKRNQVIYSSRLDPEKNPLFFLKVARAYKKMYTQCVHFVLTTSAKELRSTDPSIVQAFQHAHESGLIEVRVGQTKDQYYQSLLESKVQFNCAKQDFVSWTLLEATTCGCAPVYPYYRSFPEVLHKHEECLYAPWSVGDACRVIKEAVNKPEEICDYRDVYSPFDVSYKRMLYVMGINGVAMRNPFGGEI